LGLTFSVTRSTHCHVYTTTARITHRYLGLHICSTFTHGCWFAFTYHIPFLYTGYGCGLKRCRFAVLPFTCTVPTTAHTHTRLPLVGSTFTTTTRFATFALVTVTRLVCYGLLVTHYSSRSRFVRAVTRSPPRGLHAPGSRYGCVARCTLHHSTHRLRFGLYRYVLHRSHAVAYTRLRLDSSFNVHAYTYTLGHTHRTRLRCVTGWLLRYIRLTYTTVTRLVPTHAGCTRFLPQRFTLPRLVRLRLHIQVTHSFCMPPHSVPRITHRSVAVPLTRGETPLVLDSVRLLQFAHSLLRWFGSTHAPVLRFLRCWFRITFYGVPHTPPRYGSPRLHVYRLVLHVGLHCRLRLQHGIHYTVRFGYTLHGSGCHGYTLVGSRSRLHTHVTDWVLTFTRCVWPLVTRVGRYRLRLRLPLRVTTVAPLRFGSTLPPPRLFTAHRYHTTLLHCTVTTHITVGCVPGSLQFALTLVHARYWLRSTTHGSYTPLRTIRFRLRSGYRILCNALHTLPLRFPHTGSRTLRSRCAYVRFAVAVPHHHGLRIHCGLPRLPRQRTGYAFTAHTPSLRFADVYVRFLPLFAVTVTGSRITFWILRHLP